MPGHCCHVVNSMSVTIQLDLPEALVKEAKANGLLESGRLGEMLVELRRGAPARNSANAQRYTPCQANR